VHREPALEATGDARRSVDRTGDLSAELPGRDVDVHGDVLEPEPTPCQREPGLVDTLLGAEQQTVPGPGRQLGIESGKFRRLTQCTE